LFVYLLGLSVELLTLVYLPWW